MTSNDINISDVLEALNDKMDRDLRNRSVNSGLRILKETYNSDTEWYKVFTEIQSDGSTKDWLEQGGHIQEATGGDVTVTQVNLLKSFGNTNYFVCKSNVKNNSSDFSSIYTQIKEKTILNFTCYTTTSVSCNTFDWYAFGYITEESL